MRTRALVLLLVLALASTSIQTSSSAAATLPPCTKFYEGYKTSGYVLFGLRGSGEKPQDGSGTGLGKRIEILYSELRKEPRFKNLACVYTDPEYYAAMDVPDFSDIPGWTKYVEEVSLSGSALRVWLISFLGQNPEAKVILAGYSQGAAGTHIAVSDVIRQRPELASRIKGVFLLADPLARPSDPRIHLESKKWTAFNLAPLTESVRSGGFGVVQIANNPVSIAGNYATQAVAEISKKIRVPLPGLELFQALGILGQKLSPVLQQAAATNSVVYTKVLSSKEISERKVPIFSICLKGDVVCGPLSINLAVSFFTKWHQTAYDGDTSWAKQAVKAVR